eukprot:CAMPEP_0206141422 /NCGR_PEP_ID=MMETSP1473-20131121/12839_1 /ASSEMBLY_ACC=CAM_ASM_001109 /TAXON_ID=1461547 /ORGANISM="Stichococcus sp, Strain RCC1054" /LENGTH=313 /DNA_ID=CAMNT_0053535987 /DNA_START=112 /DNA_END=1053 /DNA_ORIENTATION=-
MVLGMGRKEVPVQDPEPKLQSFESTNDLVSMTEPKTMQQHFHARGRPSSPFYIVSQSQSANMGPLGLLGFGLTTVLLQGANTTITEAGTEYLTFCFALGYGGLAQLLAGMWEAKRGKIFGAIVFSSYGAFWISFGFFGVFTQGGVFNIADAPIPSGLQMMLCLWGVLTFCFFICSLALNLALQLLLLMLTVTFFLLAKGVKSPGVNEVGGWFGVVTGAIAIYMGFAELFNAVNEHNVFPLGPMNWIALLLPKSTTSRKYDIQRTEARTFEGSNQHNIERDMSRPHNSHLNPHPEAQQLHGQNYGVGRDGTTMV